MIILITASKMHNKASLPGDAALRIHNTSTLGNVLKIAAVTHRRGGRGGRGRGGRGRGGRIHHAQHPAHG